MAPSRIVFGTNLRSLTKLTFGVLLVGANGQENLKYKFFCGSSFADIQAETCSSRQWCPTSSDDECTVPGHTCFANTPCDARTIPTISVPTYSLSQHPEYRNPSDKMFCGTSYTDAESTCLAGGEAAKARHCPDMSCPMPGQVCFIDLPCSYFVMTDPSANPFGNIHDQQLEDWELELPNPGSMESNTFCGATFQEAAASCSSATWCGRTGTSQECPNGQTCFVDVDSVNRDCEINAVVKAEYVASGGTSNGFNLNAQIDLSDQSDPTTKPTNSPLRQNDPKNRMFCGTNWNDASSNCVRERFCPNGDSDCEDGMTCQGYTQCNAVGMTALPTKIPTKSPTNEPTRSPINTNPTMLPTTAKPSREPTNKPTGVPTPKPTGVPSSKPTHAPIPYGDISRGFWCGLNYWDAMSNCAQRCPGGQDASCPGDLQCMSGVTDCKNEMGMAAYDVDVAGDQAQEEEVFYNLGGKQTAASKPKPSGNNGAQIATVGDTATTTTTDAMDDLPLQGPFNEEMVRIILYGLDGMLDAPALRSWKDKTTTYMQDFFNKYPSQQMITAGDTGVDTIRNSVYDVTVEIAEEVVEMAPMHNFNSLAVGAEVDRNNAKRNLRSNNNLRKTNNSNNNTIIGQARRTQTTGIDPDKMVMITYTQKSQYRTSLDVINENPSQLIMRRPLETPEYRADYVNYLRSTDFANFANLEYASRLLYTEFPTSAPTDAPNPVPIQPTSPSNALASEASDEPPTPNPTETYGCNLCTQGQYGVNANVIFNGEVSTCMDVYNWFLKNYQEGSGGCREGEAQLSNICCRDNLPVKKPTNPPFEVEPRPAPQISEPNPPAANEPNNPPAANEPNNPPVVNEPNNPPPTPNPTRRVTPKPTKKKPTQMPTELLEIPVDENGLPDAASLAETYYCGRNWDSVDCSTANPCPSGSTSECASDDEQCIAFTNCGGKFAFVSDPNVEGGGPDPDEVRATFFCGTSMQFLENECDGTTPCPNGPTDCEGDGEKFGCFAFTGCNEQVDPGKFVGFLRPPDEDDVDGDVPRHSAANTFFCAANWGELDNSCEDGVPKGMRPCPSGDILECEDGHGCFAFACGGGLPQASQSLPAPSPSKNKGGYSVEDMDVLKSTFFCGTSIEQIDGDCENAIPCPSGDECPDGFGCFAFSQCGGIDIDSLVDTFGDTERPTRAPTIPLEQICNEQTKMSVNVGYWQSWSIYRDEDCQQMDTATFDAAPYSHVVYSFASIDAAYRLEAWDGTYENEVPLYRDFQTVKQRHPGTKTMIAVGGWTHNDPGPMQKRFSQMASSKTNRQTFANSAVQFMRTYGFDGLDLDWEYPGLKERGGKREDYDNYVLMTKELREAFNRAPEPYELTVAVTGNITKLEMGFDLAGLAKYVDWFNVMAYDLWGSWDPNQKGYSHTDIRMIDEAVEYMSHFIQRSKLVLGLGSYARTYTLTDNDCLDLGCPFEGPGESGCEGTDGFLPYFEIADMVTNRQYDTVRFDDDSASMVMITDGNRLVSYDNTVSFNRKLQYAEEMCFMGGMLWAIDMLKDGSNPLSSNNGNSAATGDPSDQSFCGSDYQDVITGCKQPCPSGDSSQCPPGQFCFANSGCSIDNIGAPPPSKCRLCPDSSTQGIRDWLEVSFGGETMTCGDVDMTVISEFAKGTEQCDAAKQSLGDTCCYNYPDNPCMLCRSETEFLDLRALEEIDVDPESMTCFDLSKRLGPEENDSQMCTSAQKEHWDSCCYDQCTLCEGKGIKWWNEVEYEGEPLNCGEVDAMLYADETEVGTENCTEIVSSFNRDCCYDYPTTPCDVCTKENGERHTLMPNEEVDYEESTFTCAEVNNFLSPFESSSDQCEEVKDLAFDTCCFDRCSLCGEGARLDAELLVDVDGEEGTCADIESGLFQERTIDGSENCTEARSLYYDACCFEIPSSPCQLCAMDEYMHHTAEIEFNDDDVTCKSASNYLMEREDTSSPTCSKAKATLSETCCYSTCDMCGDYDLDWDVFVDFEGVGEMSCGDFNEYFREEAVVDSSVQCEEIKEEFFDTCCYSSPTTSCQLCKQGDTFYDLNDNVEVDFNGPTTCFEVANFMSRRTEDTDQVCGVTQTSLFDECCYEKCNLADKPGTYPDWSAEVQMDGNTATCLELDEAIKEAAISKDSPDCQSLQDAFSPTCSYTIPENACDICPDNAVSINLSAEWDGKEMKCSDIKSRISSREETDGELCKEAQATLQDSCCIDQCEVCDKSQKTDFVMTVYHNGVTKQCTEIDSYFYEKSILASSEECDKTKSDHSECCYVAPQTPCNLCKRGDTEYFDLMGTNSVTYMGQKMTCTDVSDMMFRREEEAGDTCSSAQEELFDACCDTKCDLCAGMGLEAGVKVSFEGRMMTCLELDLGLGPASIEAGSDQCEEMKTQHKDDCCYEKPESPCRICPGEASGVNKEVQVNYLGTETTCDSLSNYLGSREEQQGEACRAASSDHGEDCCYERCSLCGEGKADWETFVTYEGQSIACGDFEWILRGQNVAADSDQCNAVKNEFYDKCCYEPPETSCNLCHVERKYLDVSADTQINYQGSQMKCLNLYNSLFVREAAESDQCQAAKDNHADSCCFEKCIMCQVGFLDTTATINVGGSDMSCSALDMSFSKDTIVEGSAQCNEKRAEYSDACCFTLPDNPCKVCPSGSDVDGDVSVDFYGEVKTCEDIGNRLALTEEAGSQTCSATQQDFSDKCCFERCPICPDGYNLNWEVDVEYNRAQIACGQFDNIIRGNAIQRGTQECSSLTSTYSSACCYNYATAGGGRAATETTLAQVTTTGFLNTNLDTSTLSPAQKEDAKQVFQNLIKNTLEKEGVLPQGSTVTVTDIDNQGRVTYEIEMNIDDNAVSSVAPQIAVSSVAPQTTSTRPETSTLRDISNEAVTAIDSALSDPSTLEAITNEIREEAPGASDQTVAAELSSASVTDFTLEETNLETAGNTEVTTAGQLDTNIDTSSFTTAQKEEAIGVIEESIAESLQNEGVISQEDTVAVTDINDDGEVQYTVDLNIDSEVDAALKGISNAVVAELDSTLSKPETLEAITKEINEESAGASNPTVAEELSIADVSDSSLLSEETIVSTKGESTEITATGVIDTNIDTSSLTKTEKEEVIEVVEDSIETALQNDGVLFQDSTVTVTDIDDASGEVTYEVDVVIDDSPLDDISSAVVEELDTNLSKPETLGAISNEIQKKSAVASNPNVVEELSTADVSDSSLTGETSITLPGEATEAGTAGTLDTNLDLSNLNSAQRDEVMNVVEDSIETALQNEGVLSQNDVVTVTDIDDEGEVEYTVDLNVDSVIDSTLEDISSAVIAELDSTLSNPDTLEAISNEIQKESAVSSDPNVEEELSNADVSDSSLGETSITTTGESTEVTASGVLDTNIDTSSLTETEKEEVMDVVEDSIETALENKGFIPENDESVTVTVTDIDEQGQVEYEVDLTINPVTETLEDISSAFVEELDSTLSNPDTLEAISNEIKEESAVSSDPTVVEELSNAYVSDSSLGETSVKSTGENTEVTTTGVFDTNIDTSSLTLTEKEEVKEVVENSIETALQNEGTLSQNDIVTVTDINDEGEVEYTVDLNVDSDIDSTLEKISSAFVAELGSTLSNPDTLESISNEIQEESAVSSDPNIVEELSNADVSDSSLGETSITTIGENTEITTNGVLDTNIDTSSLTETEKEEAKEVVENSIQNTLQNKGFIPKNDESITVTVTDIDEQGQVEYEVDLTISPKTGTLRPAETTTLEAISDALVSQIDSTLSNPSILEEMGNEIKTESADSSVAEELSSIDIVDFVQGETSVTATGTATGAGPCNLCNAGEIGLEKEILFNGAQTSCPEVYRFLATQSEAGSDSCIAGKKALRTECCMRKCDLCSGGGIPDWYSMVNVNGNSMTCLELDAIVADSEIQNGSDQCSQLLEIAAPACCYEPPSKPCNMCQNDSEYNDVMTSVLVEYGGTTATCGQIFNTLFSREEHDSETCALIKQDLSSQCCYNKCSLCGALQTNAALSVMHDETQLGCSEFDSYIFASNLVEEGSNECQAFQDEHRENCCYDISCSLCAKGNELYTTKETSVVQYSGSEVACAEVANFLYQQEMSQGNACLAAQENIFSDCCFQQCELCEAGASINWAAATTFDGQSQSCTDVYWILVSESVEAGTPTCSGLSQVSQDCCYQIPSQQCTLCKDGNGVTYNTRWNKDVTVNGITKSCGDFNTLLATQEDDSQTCSMAKDEIFDDCCFAGSDTLVAIGNQASTDSDAPCSLCQPGQIGVSGDIFFNNNPTTCEEVYNFLINSFQESSTTCKSAQVNLSEDCCRERDKLSPSDVPAFGGDTIAVSDGESTAGQGSITAEKPADAGKVTPPTDFEFDTWTRLNGSRGSSSFARLCSAIIGVFTIGLFFWS